MSLELIQIPSAPIKKSEDPDHHQVGTWTLKWTRWILTTDKLITPSFDIIYSLRIVQFTNVLSFDSIDKVIIDHLTDVFFLILLLGTKKKKVELYCKGEMNTIIHNITYVMNDKG